MEGVGAPLDDLPVEVRRENWGWWGEPWPSGVCYDDDGTLLENMRKLVPEGEKCFYCDEPIDSTHSGTSMPFHGTEGSRIVNVHKECMLRNVLGSPEHLTGHTGKHAGMTAREEALWVWNWVAKHPSAWSAM